MSDFDDSWQVKWEFTIGRIKNIISKKGKKMYIINVEADINPKRQFENYQETCESVKHIYEAVVTTGFSKINWKNTNSFNFLVNKRRMVNWFVCIWKIVRRLSRIQKAVIILLLGSNARYIELNLC